MRADRWKPGEREMLAAQAAGYDDWYAWVIALEAEKGSEICGRWARSNQGPCRGHPMANGACRMHKGKAESGPAHAMYEDGRAALVRALPEELRAAFQAEREDPELIDISNEIALARVRRNELVGRLRTGESREAWSLMGVAWGRLQEELSEDDPDLNAVDRLVTRVGRYLETASEDKSTWDDVLATDDHISKLAERDMRRRKALAEFLHIRDGRAIIEFVVKTITNRVKDRGDVAMVIQDIRQGVKQLLGMDEREQRTPALKEPQQRTPNPKEVG